MVGNLPIAWPYLGYASLPLTRRLGRLYAAADRAWAGGIAAHVLERRGEPTPVLRKPRVVIVAELGANTSPGLLFHGVFVGLAARDDLELCFAAPRSLDSDFAAAARDAAAAVVDLDPGDLG